MTECWQTYVFLLEAAARERCEVLQAAVAAVLDHLAVAEHDEGGEALNAKALPQRTVLRDVDLAGRRDAA